VAELYRGDYLIEPRISINLMNAADQRVTVMGAVTNPGPVGIAANTSLDLASALSSAGGLATQADPDRIRLKRGDSATTYTMARLGSKDSEPVMLKHGDIISVAINPFANKRVTVLGDVQAPGAMTYPTSGDLDLKTLIGMARGLTPQADPARITIKRDGRIFSATLSENGGTALRPGDLVTVPQSRFVGKSVNILGQVGNPGPVAFPLDGELDILSAMGLAGGFARLGNKKKVVVTRQVNGRNRTQTINIEDMEEGQVPLFYLLPGDSINVPVRRF
jgi:protein involved in polysaccharide export with SLBB domain